MCIHGNKTLHSFTSSSSNEEDEDPKKSLSKKTKNSNEKYEPRSSIKPSDTSSETNTTTEDGNMILLKGDDSLWKNSSEKSVNSVLADEKQSRENDFEDYLEDLLF